MSKFKTKAHSDLKKEMAQERDRIKGLKLRRINAYLGGAALDEALRNIYSCYGLSRLGKKSPLSTAVHLLRHGSYICYQFCILRNLRLTSKIDWKNIPSL